LALVIVVLIYLYETTTWFGFLKWFPGGLNLLKFYLSIPILFFVLAGLASWNFKRLHQNRRLWQRNILAVLVAGVAIPLLAAAIYFRPWELLLPLEPRGPVRIHDPARVKFETSEFAKGIYSLLPDHRLWVGPSARYEVLDSRSLMGLAISEAINILLLPWAISGETVDTISSLACAAERPSRLLGWPSCWQR
jgi:hypothetical protein